MLKVLESEAEDDATATEGVAPTLGEMSREGVRRMLMMAVLEEHWLCTVPRGDLRGGDDASRPCE